MRNPTELTLLKSGNDLVVAGYASVELVDKQGDLITRGALNDAFKKFMGTPEHANVQLAHSNIQVGTVIPSYTDNDGRMWKSEVDDTGMFVVVKLRNDIEKAREVASEIRTGNLTGFSIGGQAFKRMRKSDKEHGEYQEISKLELHEITICEKGINPEASFRILKEDTTMTDGNVMEQMNSVLSRLEGRLDSMEKGLPPAFLEGKDDSPKEDKDMSEEKDEKEDKDEKKDDEKDDKNPFAKGNDYSDVITAEYLTWMENTLKSGGVDTGAARQHFDDLNKAQLGGFDNPDSVDGADYFAGQVRGRGQDKGTPSTNAISAISASGGKTPAGALGPVKKGYLTPQTVSDADIEAAYEVYKSAAQEQNFRGNLEQHFEGRYNKEISAAVQKQEQQQFDARGPLSEISKAIEALGERIDNISSDSTTIAKAQGRNNVQIPSTEDLAHMSWDEVHRLADESFRGA
jgi:HK97 family phage prohead protease|tara:strand:+ start:10410 stop:11789 length:1380 start_codon:yes stop_codon:yes gene_type:complete